MKVKIFSAIVLTVILYGCAQKITQQVGSPPLHEAQVDSLLAHFVAQTGVPSMSVAIGKGEKVIYAKTVGVSDVENSTLASNETKYRIGSVTKLLTATATADLIASGLIKPDDPVTKYIKEVPTAYRNITIGQLAAHTSGIRHYTRDEAMGINKAEYPSLSSSIDKFIGDTLLFAPGSKYTYSSYGYTLLGAVLEKAIGKKFTEIISERILEPAGLENILPEFYNAEIESLSKFYYPARDGKGFITAEGENYSYKWPAAGYVATASDLVRFGNALLTGKIVDSSSLSLLFTPQKTEGGSETSSGFGFRIGKDHKGRKVVHHGGETQGARAFLLIYPDQGITVALMSNVFRAPLFEGEAETIAGYFLNDYSSTTDLSGTYTFVAKNSDKTMTGNISLDKQAGTISNFMGQDLMITGVVDEGDHSRIIAVSRQGIVNIWLKPHTNGYKGAWGYDKPINEIELTK